MWLPAKRILRKTRELMSVLITKGILVNYSQSLGLGYQYRSFRSKLNNYIEKDFN